MHQCIKIVFGTFSKAKFGEMNARWAVHPPRGGIFSDSVMGEPEEVEGENSEKKEEKKEKKSFVAAAVFFECCADELWQGQGGE